MHDRVERGARRKEDANEQERGEREVEDSPNQEVMMKTFSTSAIYTERKEESKQVIITAICLLLLISEQTNKTGKHNGSHDS
jgi:hypothetical protein